MAHGMVDEELHQAQVGTVLFLLLSNSHFQISWDSVVVSCGQFEQFQASWDIL
jgi:hypothetical protein